jgi:hypothetical protein
MNRRQHKRRIYKRMGHQFACYPFGGSVKGLLRFYRGLHEVLRALYENPEQARAIYGTKDTQAQASGSHQ